MATANALGMGEVLPTNNITFSRQAVFRSVEELVDGRAKLRYGGMGRRRTRKMRQRGSWRREWRWAERRERDSSSDIRALGASGEVVVCDARGWSERRRRRAKRRSE
ncbi:uncharacterized protein BDCG_01472 [Blastomyces dermatitidis ER-3]|uniref:Uncharacterized protein n=1 Tax=Ajellomyces dermatitidis (strain ER-3 / ATCC MYA-2586) TaxID=559297 RepID=A0ABP2ERN4_AJEDR|nr:uncharacterized protein BDCG_01472 [Blastomyces dermatitidis ER-3]EEQ86352.2 hypothetical protein BDCG_01472 [Blastomyces dermatitidis ER-3]